MYRGENEIRALYCASASDVEGVPERAKEALVEWLKSAPATMFERNFERYDYFIQLLVWPNASVLAFDEKGALRAIANLFAFKPQMAGRVGLWIREQDRSTKWGLSFAYAAQVVFFARVRMLFARMLNEDAASNLERFGYVEIPGREPREFYALDETFIRSKAAKIARKLPKMEVCYGQW